MLSLPVVAVVLVVTELHNVVAVLAAAVAVATTVAAAVPLGLVLLSHSVLTLVDLFQVVVLKLLVVQVVFPMHSYLELTLTDLQVQLVQVVTVVMKFPASRVLLLVTQTQVVTVVDFPFDPVTPISRALTRSRKRFISEVIRIPRRLASAKNGAFRGTAGDAQIKSTPVSRLKGCPPSA